MIGRLGDGFTQGDLEVLNSMRGISFVGGRITTGRPISSLKNLAFMLWVLGRGFQVEEFGKSR